MNAPIILFAFNRLDAVKRTVESLLMNAEAMDSELFVFVDGPRNHVPADKEKVKAVREYVRTIQGFEKITHIAVTCVMYYAGVKIAKR